MSGYYRDGDACEECGIGSWSAPAAGTEVTQCTECTGGRVTRGPKSTSSNECGKSEVTQCSHRLLSTQIVPMVGCPGESKSVFLCTVLHMFWLITMWHSTHFSYQYLICLLQMSCLSYLNYIIYMDFQPRNCLRNPSFFRAKYKMHHMPITWCDTLFSGVRWNKFW